jgi:hypothetical protein
MIRIATHDAAIARQDEAMWMPNPGGECGWRYIRCWYAVGHGQSGFCVFYDIPDSELLTRDQAIGASLAAGFAGEADGKLLEVWTCLSRN